MEFPPQPEQNEPQDQPYHGGEASPETNGGEAAFAKAPDYIEPTDLPVSASDATEHVLRPHETDDLVDESLPVTEATMQRIIDRVEECVDSKDFTPTQLDILKARMYGPRAGARTVTLYAEGEGEAGDRITVTHFQGGEPAISGGSIPIANVVVGQHASGDENIRSSVTYEIKRMGDAVVMERFAALRDVSGIVPDFLGRSDEDASDAATRLTRLAAALRNTSLAEQDSQEEEQSLGLPTVTEVQAVELLKMLRNVRQPS